MGDERTIAFAMQRPFTVVETRTRSCASMTERARQNPIASPAPVTIANGHRFFRTSTRNAHAVAITQPGETQTSAPETSAHPKTSTRSTDPAFALRVPHEKTAEIGGSGGVPDSF